MYSIHVNDIDGNAITVGDTVTAINIMKHKRALGMTTGTAYTVTRLHRAVDGALVSMTGPGLIVRTTALYAICVRLSTNT